MRYEVKASRGSEGLKAVMLEAADATEAAALAVAQGYTVIAVKSVRSLVTFGKSAKAKFPIVLFSQELLALLDAGLSLVESLETLAEKEQTPEIKKTLGKIVTCLYEGHPLSFGLQHSDYSFPPLYIATVRASEKTGALPEALSRYVAYQTQMDSVRQKIVSASIYPALLAGVGGLVMVFLLLYVVPRFSRVYADIGGDLPFMSRMLIGWGQMISEHGEFLLAGLISLPLLFVYLFSRTAFKRWLVLKAWEMPTIGQRLYLYQLSRFYRSLGMLLRGGMPVVPALQMVSDLLQFSLKEQLVKASSSIREGQAISRSMEQYGLTTPVALRMLRVGERTGKMGEMMERIAGFYEEEMARWVERFTKLFEPLLMAFIGLLIGGVVVLMYFPIFELAESVQ